MAEKLVAIGYTKKTHGAQGELKVLVKDEFLEDFVNAEVIFLQVQGKPVPFFIENLRDAGDLILKLETIDTPSDAKNLTSKEIFLRETDIQFTQPDGEITSFQLLVGFKLFDEVTGEIGEILSIETLPHQELAVVNWQDREILIPLHPSMIVGLDEKQKKITLRLAEGLLEL